MIRSVASLDVHEVRMTKVFVVNTAFQIHFVNLLESSQHACTHAQEGIQVTFSAPGS